MRRYRLTVNPVTISNLIQVSIVHLIFNLVSNWSRCCSFDISSGSYLIKAHDKWVARVTATCQTVVRNRLPNSCIYLVAPVKSLATQREQKSCHRWSKDWHTRKQRINTLGFFLVLLPKEQHFFVQRPSESLVKQWKGDGFTEQRETQMLDIFREDGNAFITFVQSTWGRFQTLGKTKY